MARARIMLTDGTVIEMATKLAIRPAALHYVDARGKEGVVEVAAIKQVSYEHDQVLVSTASGPVAVAAEQYDRKIHGKALEKRTVLRAPAEGDIAALAVVKKR